MSNGNSSTSKSFITVGVAVLIGVLLLLLLPGQGLDFKGRWIVAVIAMTVVLWASSSIENAAATFLMLGALVAGGIPASQVLSGYASGGFWILLAVLYYGFAMRKSGLATRISYSILGLFRPSYASLLFSFLLIGIVLSLGVPSMTVRTAIMVPIAWALVQAIGLQSKSAGSALIILTSVEMAVLPGVAFLYGSLWGPAVERLFTSNNLPLSWLEYAKVMTLPTLFWCVVLVLANLWLLRPHESLQMDPAFVQDQLKKLGGWKKAEVITAVIIVFSILFWILESYHHLPAYVPGLFAFLIFSLTGILTPTEISTGVPWPLLLFLGGIFSLPAVFEGNQVNNWLSLILVPIVSPFMGNHFLLLFIIGCGMFLLRFIDPTGFVVLASVFLSLFAVLMNVGVSPLVFIGTIIFAAHPFWVTYQNFWVAMSEGITDNQAFTSGQKISFATVYAVVTLVSIVLSVFYWKWTGAL
ncbi:MAG: anion permease [Acidobacteria bacterium]|nr:anion permease [Acidobacteriota bacterium]